MSHIQNRMRMNKINLTKIITITIEDIINILFKLR